MTLGQLQQGEQMGDVAVHPAVREQAHEMQGALVLFAGLNGRKISRVFEKGAILDGVADFGQVLKNHAAGADVGVSHLAVPHLAVGQAHVQAGGLQLAEGVLGEEIVQMRGRRGLYRVARDVVAQGKPIHDDQCCRCFHKPFPRFPERLLRWVIRRLGWQ